MKHPFQILDIRQCKTMIPERREINEMSHMIAQRSAGRVSRLWNKQEKPGRSPAVSPVKDVVGSLGRLRPPKFVRQNTGEKRTVCVRTHTHRLTCMHAHTQSSKT